MEEEKKETLPAQEENPVQETAAETVTEPVTEPKTETVVEPVVTPVAEPIEDDDFADTKRNAEIEAAKQKKQEEEAVKKEEEEEEEALEELPDPFPEQNSYEYTDDLLDNIEKARVAFYKEYKKINGIKIAISVVGLAVIILFWILPNALKWGGDNSVVPMVVSLSVAAGVLVLLGVMSFLTRKANDKRIKAYFGVLYENLNQYLFNDMPVENIQGKVEDKISKDEFAACGMYPGASSIGSRDNITFTYKDMDCALADAAAQKEAGKAMQTVFVGKYLRTTNNFQGKDDGLVIYFRGNKRALPPEILPKLNLLEKNKFYKIYGDPSDKKYLTPKIRSMLKDIHTNKVLVDVAIAIKPGKTYFALGYEDSLMVLPMQKPFNPGPTREYKEELAMFLDLAYAFYEKKGENKDAE